MSYYQYGGSASMAELFKEVADGEKGHDIYLNTINKKYWNLLEQPAVKKGVFVSTGIDTALLKDNMNIMNVRMLYFLLSGPTWTGFTDNNYPVNWPLGKTVGDEGGVHTATELISAMADRDVGAQQAARTAWDNNDGNNFISVMEWGVPSNSYEHKFGQAVQLTVATAGDLKASTDRLMTVVTEAIGGPSVVEWRTRSPDQRMDIFRLLNSFRNFVYLKNFINKGGEKEVSELVIEYKKIICNNTVLHANAAEIDVQEIFRINIILLEDLREYIKGDTDAETYFSEKITNHQPGSGSPFDTKLNDELAKVAFNFGVAQPDLGNPNPELTLKNIYEKLGFASDATIKKFAFLHFTMRQFATGGGAQVPVQMADLGQDPARGLYIGLFEAYFPYFCREVEEIVLMREALVKAFTNSAGATVETKIEVITECLTAMGDTWGGAAVSPASTQAAQLKAAQNKAKTAPQLLTDKEKKLLEVHNESSDEVATPPGKETLDNLVQSIQTYLMTISIPTSNPTIEKVKPFIYNIYRALMDAHRANMVQVFNVEEVLSIIEGDKTFKDGFSANNTSIIRRKWSKKDRHITIRLVKENKLYDNLPSARGTGEQIDPGGEEFKKLSDFTLKLWKVLGETPGNIHQYFQNLGDTKIEITQEGYEITYIVLGQFSKLNLLARGRTDDIVKRLKSSVRNKAEVNLGEELGGDDGVPAEKYNIFLLERTDSDTLVSNIPQKDDEFTLELKGREKGVLRKVHKDKWNAESKNKAKKKKNQCSASFTGSSPAPENMQKDGDGILCFHSYEKDDWRKKWDRVDPGIICRMFRRLLDSTESRPKFAYFFNFLKLYGPDVDWLKTDETAGKDKYPAIYFNKELSNNPQFGDAVGSKCANGSCVLVRINNKPLYLNDNYVTGGEINLDNLKSVIKEIESNAREGDGYNPDKPLTFTFKTPGQGGGYGTVLDNGAPAPAPGADPTSSTVSLKVDDSWKNIPVSKEEKKLLENLSKYSANPGVAQDQGAQELVKRFNFVSQLLKSNNEEILGAPISDKPDPKDKSDKGDGDKGDGDNTESAEMKKLKAELEAQKQAQATAIATQNTQALAAAQRQATQLQSQINQQTRQNQNTGRPNQNTGQPNQNTGRPNQNTGQSNIRPAQQGPSSAQSNIRPAQQGPSSAQSNIRSSQQPGKEVGQRSGVQPGENPSQPGEKPEQGPSFIERLLGSSGDIDKQKEELKTEKDDLEKQKEEEIKMKDQMAKAEAVQKKAEIAEKEEDIPANLFKQLYDKSSPEYVKVKEMMIAQIKLIHKYNLLKQESFGLMLDNSKYGTLEEENTRQKELIRDLENKIFNIIQQILGNKGSNKLNKDLLSYINDLKSSDSDGSLVDTSKYLELINTANNSSKNKTLKKYKHKQPVNSKKKKSIAKRNNTKKTPMKYIKKRTPKKSKFIGAKKGRRTPIKPKNI